MYPTVLIVPSSLQVFTKVIENGYNNLMPVVGGPAEIPKTSDKYALPVKQRPKCG